MLTKIFCYYKIVIVKNILKYEYGNDFMDKRFVRTSLIIGEENIEKLGKATVAVSASAVSEDMYARRLQEAASEILFCATVILLI